MAPDIILSKCITLLFRESQLENATETSADLVRTAVEKIRINDVAIGIPTKRDSSIALRNLVLEMCRNPVGYIYETAEFLQQIRLLTNGDQTLYLAISDSISEELAGPALKRVITNLKKTVAGYFREQRLAEIVSKAHRDLSFNRHTIPDLTQYIRNVVMELEVTSSKAQAKDTAILKSMDLGDDNSLREVFENMADSNSEGLAYVTGWKELNDALQGGPRPGDTVVVGALQHDYKTGFSLSLFAHIAVHNLPKTKDPTKKPLLYRVTCEDPLRNNAQFLYLLLKYDETKEVVNVKGVSVNEMIEYVKRRLQINGFHILLDEVNPMNWSYQALVNRIIELESKGYKVEVLEIDYLSKIPTTGCAQGALGDDVMEQLSRVRAYASANGILFITPHQLSTEAKRLLQVHPPETFLHAIKGGGYFEKTKGLDRIYDIGLLLHKIEATSGDYLHVVIDKHRYPTVVDSSLKSFYLEFPACKMPIPSNVLDPYHKPHRKIPRGSSVKDDAFFRI